VANFHSQSGAWFVFVTIMQHRHKYLIDTNKHEPMAAMEISFEKSILCDNASQVPVPIRACPRKLESEIPGQTGNE